MKNAFLTSRYLAAPLVAMLLAVTGAAGQQVRQEATPAAALTQAVPAPPSTIVSEAAVPAQMTPAVPAQMIPAARSAAPGAMNELSPLSMFQGADLLVKGVMIGLMLASLVTWTILAGKTVELGTARRRLARALLIADRAASLAEAKIALSGRGGLLPNLVEAAIGERSLSGPSATIAGLKERAGSRFADLVRAETQAMRRGMGALATIGSTAPFVGLFGTVWGIMNSFIGISKSQTTNLAVVAPGIAEALLATATGLAAAIPAVVIYNHFARSVRTYQLLTGRASSSVERLLSRDLERERSAQRAQAAE